MAVGRLAVFGVQSPAAEGPALRDDHPVGSRGGTSTWAVTVCGLFFTLIIEASVRRPMPPNSSCEVPWTSCGRPARSGLKRSTRRSSRGRTSCRIASVSQRRWSSCSLSGSSAARSCAASRHVRVGLPGPPLVESPPPGPVDSPPPDRERPPPGPVERWPRVLGHAQSMLDRTTSVWPSLINRFDSGRSGRYSGGRCQLSARVLAAEPWLTRKQSREPNVTATVTATR